MMTEVCNTSCTKVDDGCIEQHGEAMGMKEHIESGKASKEGNMDVDAKKVKFVCQSMNPVS